MRRVCCGEKNQDSTFLALTVVCTARAQSKSISCSGTLTHHICHGRTENLVPSLAPRPPPSLACFCRPSPFLVAFLFSLTIGCRHTSYKAERVEQAVGRHVPAPAGHPGPAMLPEEHGHGDQGSGGNHPGGTSSAHVLCIPFRILFCDTPYRPRGHSDPACLLCLSSDCGTPTMTVLAAVFLLPQLSYSSLFL